MTRNDQLERMEHDCRVYLVVVCEHEGPINFTCEDCADVYTCEYAYDEWNLNGDRIMDK